MNLSDVSKTALMILVCRVVETEKAHPVFNDPMAVLSLERLLPIASVEEKALITRWKKMYSGLQARDARARIQNVLTFDRITNDFISNHPGSTVVNLACGLDTRYWRIDHKNCCYIELDLPEMVELKREVLKDQLGYELIGCSVFDPAWIDRVTTLGDINLLLLAEGLFMYLPRQESITLLQTIAQRFSNSQLVLDMAPEKYTRGIWKWMIGLESRAWGLDVSLSFGINHPDEIEGFAKGLTVIGVEKGSLGPIITVSINQAIRQ